MPRSLDPASRLTMVLACDIDKPKETQPRIFARTLTLNQQRKLMSAMERMRADGDKIEAALDAAEICLTGWENMTDQATGNPIPFGREAIGDVLSMEELAEVFGAVMAAGSASAEDKKKSESPR